MDLRFCRMGIKFPYIFTVVFLVVLPETIEDHAVDRFLKRAHRFWRMTLKVCI